MPEQKARVEILTSALKDIVAALRDSVLFLVFMLLLFFPTVINDRLAAAGFKKGTIGGLEWEAALKTSAEQTKTVGMAVSRADENYKNLVDRLAELEQKAKDPSLKASINQLGQQAQTVQGELVAADRAVKRSLGAQQRAVAEITPSSVSTRGWLFLGKVTEDKNKWAPGSPQTVSAYNPLLIPGSTLTITDDAYLRADAVGNARSSAPILGALRPGEVVRALEVDYSHSRTGGWFVWAKVERT